jgi:hypothetical protein
VGYCNMLEMIVSKQIAFKRLVEGSSPSGRTKETARKLAVFLFLVDVSLKLFRFVPPLFPHYSVLPPHSYSSEGRHQPSQCVEKGCPVHQAKVSLNQTGSAFFDVSSIPAVGILSCPWDSPVPPLR